MQNNSITQLHNTTPAQLTELILQGVQHQFNKLKKELEPTNKETYLTRLQAAKMLSISLTTLNDWGKKKILTPMKLGNRTYFKLSEIESKLINSNIV